MFDPQNHDDRDEPCEACHHGPCEEHRPKEYRAWLRTEIRRDITFARWLAGLSACDLRHLPTHTPPRGLGPVVRF